MTQDSDRTILLVDDDVDIRTVLSIGLEHFGYRVLTAHDARTAMDAIEKHSIDLIIIDNGLPDIGGIELGTQILQQPSRTSCPLVLFTGTISKELEERAKSAGFTDFWMKPMSLNALRRHIDNLLNRLGD